MSNDISEADPAPPRTEVQERPAAGISGWPVLIVSVIVLLAGAAGIITGIGFVASAGDGGASGGVLLVGGIVLALAALVAMVGLVPVAPQEARVLQLLGRYTGTIRTDGLRWINPITDGRHKVSTRIRNHETSVLKVNDAAGTPVEIAAVVVWQVTDTAQAMFAVDDYAEFVRIQSETAVRHIANNYPYDGSEEHRLSLRDNADEITGRLNTEIAERVQAAGVRIIESRITHLAYAPEIAGAMLRRQQASAILAARREIVEGSVGMVEQALTRLTEHDFLELDEERKASMVSNLMVVLCSDNDTQPVVNTGSIYH